MADSSSSQTASELKHRGKAFVQTPPLSPPRSPELKAGILVADPAEDYLDLSKSAEHDNYVQKTLDRQKVLPPVTLSNLLQNIQWVSFLALTVTPALAIYGMFTTSFRWGTFAWAIGYYFMTGMSITAGYHRLWAHRSYNAAAPLQYFFAIFGAGAVEGSVKWWSRGHRAHHRYTDTDLDPYNAHKGFFYSHVGWMLIKPRRAIGTADISDLSKNKVIKWQQKWYLYLIVGMGFIFPTLVAGLGWGDWKGGFFFAGAARLCFVHHSTFCVNSLAHWLGEAPFDDKHSPRDSMITALVTNGEGYHNFHHQFPSDFRNAIRWYQYDPTKWFISLMHLIGQASHLKTFPANEIKKGQYTMQLKKLQAQTAELKWPETKLPIVSWEEFVEESKSRPLIAIHGYIIDCESFEADHPGGAHLIKRAIGTDATTAFFGGVYDHSNAAHNLLAMMRVGILEAGMEVEHLKSDFENSPINPDRPSSTLPSPPPGQPMAQMADKSTLNVPPSEHFRIVETVPPPRPSGRKGGLGDVTRTLAQAEGENKEYSGEKLE